VKRTLADIPPPSAPEFSTSFLSQKSRFMNTRRLSRQNLVYTLSSSRVDEVEDTLV
jgi:hypothetical protein